MCKIFVDTMPRFELVGDIVEVTRADGVCEAWPGDVFEAAVFVAMEVATTWRSNKGRPRARILPFKKA